MADIYKSKAVSPQYQSSFRASQVRYDDKSKELQQMAAKEKAEADDIYSLSISNTATMNMNELYTQYENDPKALSEGLKKLGSKIADEIPTDEMKVKFLSNYMLNSQSLVNKAQANFDRIQDQKRKSAIFDNIQNNINQMELSFTNGLTGVGSIDDMVNFQQAIEKNKRLINALDKDGTYLFSDAQRKAYLDSMDRVYINGFKSAYSDMSREQKRNIGEMLDNDSFTMSLGKDGETTKVNLKDVIGEKSYREMKNAIRTVKAVNEDRAYDYMNSDATNDQKMAFINEQEYEGNITNAFATKARRILKTQSEGKQKTLSDAEVINNVLQQASDLVNTADSDEEYLMGIKNLKKYVFEMQDENKINSKDAVTLWNQVSSLTRNKTAEATRNVSLAFDDVNNLISESLPPESRAEAVRELFYMTGGKELDTVNLRKNAVEVIQGIQNKNRARAIQQVNNIVSEEKINKNADDFFKGFGL